MPFGTLESSLGRYWGNHGNNPKGAEIAGIPSNLAAQAVRGLRAPEEHGCTTPFGRVHSLKPRCTTEGTARLGIEHRPPHGWAVQGFQSGENNFQKVGLERNESLNTWLSVTCHPHMFQINNNVCRLCRKLLPVWRRDFVPPLFEAIRKGKASGVTISWHLKEQSCSRSLSQPMRTHNRVHCDSIPERTNATPNDVSGSILRSPVVILRLRFWSDPQRELPQFCEI